MLAKDPPGFSTARPNSNDPIFAREREREIEDYTKRCDRLLTRWGLACDGDWLRWGLAGYNLGFQKYLLPPLCLPLQHLCFLTSFAGLRGGTVAQKLKFRSCFCTDSGLAVDGRRAVVAGVVRMAVL